MILKIIRLLVRLYWSAEYKRFRTKYDIDKTFVFNGYATEMYGDGEIKIGRNVYCGHRCAFQALTGYKIIIGCNTSISHNVRIYTQNRDAGFVIGLQNINQFRCGDVYIGTDCWIGANVFICEGVTIGDRVVVGANSVVTKNIPSNSVVGGIPAKVIKSKMRKYFDD